MSLAISPNLDAMLEYDDRLRTSRDTHKKSRPGSVTPESQASVATEPEPVVIVGLPPPPRSKKFNNGSLRTPLVSRFQGSSHEGNVLDISSIIQTESGSDDEESPANPRANPYINPAPNDDSRSPSPIVFHRKRSSASLSRSSSYHASRREIDAETVSRPLIQRSSSYEEPSTSPQRLHFRSLTKNEKVLRSDHPEYGHNRQRSGSTNVTETTWDPMSTTSEQHISISSTLYTGSIHSLAFNSASPSRAHDSIIEILDPYQPEGSLEARSFKYPIPSPVTSASPVNPSASSVTMKPPLPSTPKPNFHRPTSLHYSSRGRTLPQLPVTTGNHLSSRERAELIRKTRKLAQVFGQIPHAKAVTQGVEASSLPLSSNDRQRRRHGFLSITGIKPLDDNCSRPSQEGALYVAANARRYSAPLTPKDFSCIIDPPENRLHDRMRDSSGQSHRNSDPGSPVSFIELSDDESGADTPRAGIGRFSHLEHSLSLESLSLEERAEVDRRRKRDKLTKLHRFLGSRVPPELALGLTLGTSLPSAATVEEEGEQEEDKLRFGIICTEGGSPATEYFTASVDQTDRLKCELDVEEKAVNVWRAAKMEKVFGIAPPQTLYHTRHVSQVSNFHFLSSRPVESTSTSAHSNPVVRNFRFDSKGKKTKRPGTSESSQFLIPTYVDAESSRMPVEVYHSYRESLNTLGDIIDRDDKESLEQLHEILHEAADPESPLQAFVRRDHTEILGRRMSLPLTPSIRSFLSSESSVTSPPPEVSSFEVRRRRAAKLTNFFGVNHRDIMNDILESIESGVREESGNGNLNPEQVRELLQKLRKLKNKT